MTSLSITWAWIAETDHQLNRRQNPMNPGKQWALIGISEASRGSKAALGTRLSTLLGLGRQASRRLHGDNRRVLLAPRGERHEFNARR